MISSTEPGLGGSSDDARGILSLARLRAGLSLTALYLRYIGLGGLASPVEVAAHCDTGNRLPRIEHNVLVQAINERFLEMGRTERMSFM